MEDELLADDASQDIESMFPCQVLPLSKLTVNESGVEDGYHSYFFVSALVRTPVFHVGGRRGGWESERAPR